ncbi:MULTISPECIES: hypothetical protein [Streptomyces]|uniref:Type II toxin-antitoxin system RelE/ParE family toxin n=1 Tax=Streptomyces harbinensis TaxID=1176198 RepID=A0A1I6WD09_9ACTN|nr:MULTISPECIES: hypothetical protein [Streptomyces]SFT23863.1 hypothetical protein SAMN05444716_1216 [Streptomyces harbinensis]
MTYKLRVDPVIHDQYTSLPDDARAELAGCLLDALADPHAHSAPYGTDDGVVRTIARGAVAGVIIIGEDTITLVQIISVH